MANNMDIDNNSFTIRDIMDVTPNQRIAMLIDGDNAQPSMIEKMLAETTKYGLITIRRIYGDWTASNMGGQPPIWADGKKSCRPTRSSRSSSSAIPSAKTRQTAP